jgi:hypothetical protein
MNESVPITNPAAALRVVRMLKIAFVASAILFLRMIITIPAHPLQPVNSTVETAITIVALVNIILGYAFPRFMLRAAQRASGNTSNVPSIQRWFTASVVGFAILESCSLFGVALHFMGAELLRSELLIAVGIVATVFFSAGAPPADRVGNSAQS